MDFLADRESPSRLDDVRTLRRAARRRAPGRVAARRHDRGDRRPAERRQVEPAEPAGRLRARSSRPSPAPRATWCASARHRRHAAARARHRGAARGGRRGRGGGHAPRPEEMARADRVLFVIDAARSARGRYRWIAPRCRHGVPVTLVLNKCDLHRRALRHDTAAAAAARSVATSGHGIAAARAPQAVHGLPTNGRGRISARAAPPRCPAPPAAIRGRRLAC